MRWFFGRIQISVLRQTAKETLFSHQKCHVINSQMLLLDKTTVETIKGSMRVMV